MSGPFSPMDSADAPVIEYRFALKPGIPHEWRRDITMKPLRFRFSEKCVYVLPATGGFHTLTEPEIVAETVVLIKAIGRRTRREYAVRREVRITLKEDGHRNIELSLEPATLTLSGSVANVVVTGNDGSRVFDSRDAQEQEVREEASLIATDLPYSHMVDSLLAYHADSKKSFGHLYNLLEAVKTKFGSSKAACASLGISHTEWRAVSGILNNSQISNSRHPGRWLLARRKSTQDEDRRAETFIETVMTSYRARLNSMAPVGEP